MRLGSRSSISPPGSTICSYVSFRPASLADDDATLRGVDAYGQAVAGTSILVRSTNGQAQFTLVSGNAAGTILIEALSDRADNDVSNGVTEAIYNHVAV